MNKDQQLALGALLEENNLAFEHVIWLPGNWAQTCETLAELLEDGDHDKVLLKVFSKRGLKDYRKRESRQNFADYETCEGLKVGFLAQVSTPSPSFFGAEKAKGGKPRHGTYTWGCTNFEWFYGFDLEDIVQQAVVWKDDLCARAWKEQQKKAKETL